MGGRVNAAAPTQRHFKHRSTMRPVALFNASHSMTDSSNGAYTDRIMTPPLSDTEDIGGGQNQQGGQSSSRRATNASTGRMAAVVNEAAETTNLGTEISRRPSADTASAGKGRGGRGSSAGAQQAIEYSQVEVSASSSAESTIPRLCLVDASGWEGVGRGRQVGRGNGGYGQRGNGCGCTG